MANIKSAEKRAKVNESKKMQNKMVSSQMKTAIKKFNAAVAANDVELATALMPIASSRIDNAASKGVIHKNAANRKKSQIAATLYQLKSGIILVKVDAKTLKQTEQKAAAVRKAEEKAASIAAYKESRAAKDEAKLIKKNPKLAKKISKQKAAKGVETVAAPEIKEEKPAKKAPAKKEAVTEEKPVKKTAAKKVKEEEKE